MRPFKLSSPVASIARQTDGRFTKVVAPMPNAVADIAVEKDVTNAAALRAAAVPMRDVGKGAPENVGGPGAAAGAPVYPEANPFPPAEDKRPFRFTR